MNLKKLKDPFPAEDIEWRVSRTGLKKSGDPWCKVLAYITSRAIMDRLDDVCGQGNWYNKFKDISNNGVECTIYIKCCDEWIGKTDAAQNTQIEAVKGGRSDAMKRAGVQWGIGRYLYNLTENWGNISSNGIYNARAGEKPNITYFKWNPPQLPEWALPSVEPITFPELEKAKKDFPEYYKEMTEHFQGIPANAGEAKLAMNYINQLIDSANK